MADLKNLTVQALRDLARKALGRGHSKLKTKGELIAALQSAERSVTRAAEKAAGRVKQARDRAARAVEAGRGKGRELARGRGGEAKERAEGGKGKPTPERDARAEAKAPRVGTSAGKAVREAARAVREMAQAAQGKLRQARSAPAGAEPDPEGHMVARVAGEEAARVAPHPLTESAMETARAARPAPRPAPRGAATPEADEGLGELPWSYADDALMALPRDPRTLFLYWDHAPDTLREAWEALDGGKPQIWVFVQEPGGGWSRVRILDFALESRSYYVHDLDPGRVYRAEIHVVDRQGRDRLLPRASNPMRLPAAGPSPLVDDRFMRLPWGERLERLLREAQAAGPFPDEVRAELARLSDWSRFAREAGGSSAGGAGGGGMGGRSSSPWTRPSSQGAPSSPWGRAGDEER